MATRKADADMTANAATADAEPREGFDEKGERRSVTLASLQKEFGEKRGEVMFTKIAEAGGFGHPRDLPSDAALDLTGLSGKRKEEVQIILGE